MTTPEARLKSQLRSDALTRRLAVPPEAAAAYAARLAREGAALAERTGARSASAFFSIRNEPDTQPLLTALRAMGLETALPVTVGGGEPLIFRRWSAGDPTVTGAMRIPEPLPTSPALDPDLLFVPLAAFDRRGHRLGYGAGHYDRTLKTLRERKRVIAVGVGYAAFELARVPAEPHDEPLDFVLTENELIAAEI